jgi:hypothetical protein
MLVYNLWQNQVAKGLFRGLLGRLLQIQYTSKGDKSVTTHIETNGVYDSMKYPMSSEGIVDWKILTLKQLRRDESRTKKKEGSR